MPKPLSGLFSVVVPLHNKAQHINRAIDSVLAQSLPCRECIVVNDASTDGSAEIVISRPEPVLRLIERATPGPGGYAARNLGARWALSEWVAFLDADDEWHPEHLQRLAELVEAYPHAELLSSGWTIHESEGATPDPHFLSFAEQGHHSMDLTTYVDRSAAGCAPVWTSVTAVRKTTLIACGGFPEARCVRGGDRDTWLRLMIAGATLAWSPHIGATYFRDSDNMVTRGHAPMTDHCTRATVLDYLKNEPQLRLRRRMKRLSNHYVDVSLRRKIREGRLRPGDLKYVFPDVNSLRFLYLLSMALLPNVVVQLLRRAKEWRRST